MKLVRKVFLSKDISRKTNINCEPIVSVADKTDTTVDRVDGKIDWIINDVPVKPELEMNGKKLFIIQSEPHKASYLSHIFNDDYYS